MDRAGARRNLLLLPEPASRHDGADTTDWTGTWVCVGFVEQLTEVGAVLPATIGHHAAHVRRTADGFIAALNARPFGGCMSVPVHCGSTRNVKCPHLACAFSEDGGVLDGTTDPGGRARAEFVGDGRRTVELPLAQSGPLLFVNVTLEAPAPPPVVEPFPSARSVARGSQLVSGTWLAASHRAAAAVSDALGADAVATAVAPNLVTVRSAAETFAVMSRPAGHTRSTVQWALHRSRDGVATVDDGLIQHALWSMSRRS